MAIIMRMPTSVATDGWHTKLSTHVLQSSDHWLVKSCSFSEPICFEIKLYHDAFKAMAKYCEHMFTISTEATGILLQHITISNMGRNWYWNVKTVGCGVSSAAHNIPPQCVNIVSGCLQQSTTYHHNLLTSFRGLFSSPQHTAKFC